MPRNLGHVFLFTYSLAVWSTVEAFPWGFWLLVLGLSCFRACREPFKDALHWDPEIVAQIARRKIEDAEANGRRMVDHPYSRSRPRGH